MITLHQRTREEVLAILVDQHRHQLQVDPEAESDIRLNSETSIADWRLACDLIDWRGLGNALNEEWGMSLKMSDWQNVLEPAEHRTLGGLCEVIAREARIESLSERGFLGCISPEGRAFRALREVLLQLGMSRCEIRPNTQLAPLLNKYGWRFVSPCIRLAPGALPAMRPVGLLHHCLILGWGVLMFASIGLALIRSPLVAWTLVPALLAMLLLWIPLPVFRGSIAFPGITTLGELAACIGNATKGEQDAPADSQSGL